MSALVCSIGAADLNSRKSLFDSCHILWAKPGALKLVVVCGGCDGRLSPGKYCVTLLVFRSDMGFRILWCEGFLDQWIR